MRRPILLSAARSRGVTPSFSFGFDTIATDFTFTRASGSTRVNASGLIEEVTAISEVEEVTNGTFDLGSEEIVNGTFDTDSDWSKGSGWSISGGKAIALNTNGSLEQYLLDVVGGKEYVITFDYVYTSGTVVLYAFGNNLGTLEETKTYSFTTTATGSTTKLQFYGTGTNLTATIDNMSVKQVNPNDSWNITNVGGLNGWRIADGRAICDTVNPLSGRNLNSTTSLTSGKTYKLTLDILQSVDGMTVLVGATSLAAKLPTRYKFRI